MNELSISAVTLDTTSGGGYSPGYTPYEFEEAQSEEEETPVEVEDAVILSGGRCPGPRREVLLSLHTRLLNIEVHAQWASILAGAMSRPSLRLRRRRPASRLASLLAGRALPTTPCEAIAQSVTSA